MASLASQRRELADLIKSRDLNRIVYFHTDHFEPWKKLEGRRQLSRENADDLVRFADALKPIDFARRLTLFYRNFFKVILGEREGGLKAHPDDKITFIPRTEAERKLCTDGMSYLSNNTRHDLQVHIHHESFTYNLVHKQPRFVDYFSQPEARALDDDRLAFALRMHKQYFREETGIHLKKWYFVHGHWALNASDPEICWITREIEILMEHGCAGDFTFPAGRTYVNPQLKFPYLCKPVNAPRGYDLPECEPEFAYGNGAAASKFFIWASEINQRGSSIDYYVPWVRQRLEEPLAFAREIVEKSFACDGTLFFKTHAHSLYPHYFEGSRKPIFPHEHPGVQNLMCLVFDAATLAGCEVEFLGASDVHERFMTARHERAGGFAAVLETLTPTVTTASDTEDTESRTDGGLDEEAEASAETESPGVAVQVEEPRPGPQPRPATRGGPAPKAERNRGREAADAPAGAQANPAGPVSAGHAALAAAATAQVTERGETPKGWESLFPARPGQLPEIGDIKSAISAALSRSRPQAPADTEPVPDRSIVAGNRDSDTAMPIEAGLVSPQDLGGQLLRQSRALPRFNGFNDAALAVIAARMAKLGPHGSGAYAHYQRRVSRGEAIGKLERTVANFVRLYSGYERHVEIGTCFGVLPMLLATLGFRATGVESDKRRFDTAFAVREALLEEYPDLDTKCDFVCAAFPDGLDGQDLSADLAIITDLLSSALKASSTKFIEGLSRFGGVLIEVDRFGDLNETVVEQNRLIQQLRKAGLGKPREAFLAGERLVLFEKKSRLRPRAVKAA